MFPFYLILLLISFIPLFYCLQIQQPKTGYNEAEARLLFNLAAGAYATSPEECVKNTFLNSHQPPPRLLHSNEKLLCDNLGNTCGFYLLVDDHSQILYVAFRGTKSKFQLFTEGWFSLQPSVDFYEIGKSNLYFTNAMEILWPKIFDALNEFSNFKVIFTGHSLGGAIASLAALKTVLKGMRRSEALKLYTFGQPRVGNVALAMKHNELVPQSYRVVHGIDIIPHLPGCAKKEIMGAKSHPCNPKDFDKPYHHGIEIYYPHEMHENSKYIECIGGDGGYPMGEDYSCSDSLTFIPEYYHQYIHAHVHYFEHDVKPYGKLQCNSTMDEEKRYKKERGENRNKFKQAVDTIGFALNFVKFLPSHG